MVGDDKYYDDDGGERTAIVSLAELRRGAATAPRDRHLLIRVQGTELGQVLALTESAYTFGRSAESDLWVNDTGMSRRHARLVRDGDGYVLEDLESANGTFVQGERVTQRRLRDGDTIQLGPRVAFRYSLTDVDEEGALRRLYEASVKDALTGACNREHLDERLKAEVSYARRHHAALSLIMLDLDHFKRVNDTHGHPAGDAVLVEASARIRRDLRAEDIFARYGGEEFVVILRGIELENAARVAERLRRIIAAAPVSFEQTLIAVTGSFGVASLGELAEPSPEALIAAADHRLYAAKRSGRDRVVSEGRAQS